MRVPSDFDVDVHERDIGELAEMRLNIAGARLVGAQVHKERADRRYAEQSKGRGSRMSVRASEASSARVGALTDGRLRRVSGRWSGDCKDLTTALVVVAVGENENNMK